MTHRDDPILIPPRGGGDIGDYSLRDFAARWLFQQSDLAQLDRYRTANAALLLDGDERKRVVFIGDSITEFWTALGRLGGVDWHGVNRGIAGQNSAQMLLRFLDEAVDLDPRAIILSCGTNDMRSYAGSPAIIGAEAVNHIRRAITAMADITASRGIGLALATLPPVGAQPETYRDPAAIRLANAWIARFADERDMPIVDYYAALADDEGMLPADLSDDGVHPNMAGYDRMMAALIPVLAKLGFSVENAR
jgi:acyl-CoA thioesterase I